jgi:signal transduction histidine kinase
MLSTIDTAIQSVRHLSTELRPHMLDDLGLLPALESYLQDFVKWSGVSGQFISEVQQLDLDGEAATACFRIVQEALTNVARHAQATQVTVRVAPAGDCVHLSVSDNGRGLNAEDRAARGHFGLVGMHERARLLAADLEITSEPGLGTTVLLSLPRTPPPPAS